ncbi:MAG TPA: hypothetical protein VFG52_08560, partial [Xanthomonadales bacterium]|nr:hypothetical protein [Xanthomonadales bacterium]
VVSAAGDEKFFLRVAIIMSIFVVAGFTLSLVLGRSTFASPLRVHIHAILFMGWMVIFLLQNFFAATKRLELHRRLGWLASAWLVLMVVSGTWVTILMVRNGTVPFFFRPAHFLVFDPLALYTFAGLTAVAIALRRNTAWHRRLHFCSMAIIIAPAFGRLLPMPYLQPWSWEATFAVSLAFLLVIIGLDMRRSGRLHPAWPRGIAVIIGLFVATQVLTYSPIGGAIYNKVTTGSKGATIAPLEFGSPPPGLQITGRS